MVDINYINPGTPVAGPYSPGVTTGNMIFVSGQGPDPGTTDIKDQTLTAFEKIKKIIEAAGGRVSNIVKVTVFLKDISMFNKMNMAYKKFFKNNGINEKFPARTTVEVSNLPIETMLIEIDIIAAI